MLSSFMVWEIKGATVLGEKKKKERERKAWNQWDERGTKQGMLGRDQDHKLHRYSTSANALFVLGWHSWWCPKLYIGSRKEGFFT